MSTYRPQQPFKGMTMAQMKKKWQSMTPAERSRNVETFRAAAKNAPKAKSKIKPKISSSTPKPKTKPKVDGSVKATRRKTKYELDVEAKDKQQSRSNSLKMKNHPKAPKSRPRGPKAGDTKTVNGQSYYYDGNKWVKGKTKSTRFKR